MEQACPIGTAKLAAALDLHVASADALAVDDNQIAVTEIGSSPPPALTADGAAQRDP